MFLPSITGAIPQGSGEASARARGALLTNLDNLFQEEKLMPNSTKTLKDLTVTDLENLIETIVKRTLQQEKTRQKVRKSRKLKGRINEKKKKGVKRQRSYDVLS